MGDRKRKYGWNNAVKQKSVEGGISGLFITCEGLEKRAICEAYNLIDQILGEPEKVAVEAASDDEDIADAIKKACNETRDQRLKTRRCVQQPTGVKNCLFVTVKGADMVDLSEKMVELAQASPCCRFLQRVLPVEETAELDLKKLSEMITKCVARHMVKKKDGAFPTYALEFKSRNNDSLKKADVLEMLNDAMNALAPSAKVDLNHAHVTFWVQLVRKTLMVGGVRDFYGKRKYNMRHQAEKQQEKSESAPEAPESAEASEAVAPDAEVSEAPGATA